MVYLVSWMRKSFKLKLFPTTRYILLVQWPNQELSNPQRRWLPSLRETALTSRASLRSGKLPLVKCGRTRWASRTLRIAPANFSRDVTLMEMKNFRCQQMSDKKLTVNPKSCLFRKIPQKWNLNFKSSMTFSHDSISILFLFTFTSDLICSFHFNWYTSTSPLKG